MVGSTRRRTAALYDDASTRPAVTAIIERCGFAVAVLRGPGSQLLAQTRAFSPTLVVFDLASGGSRGLAIIGDLRRAVPACTIVLLAPFEGLRESALAAGAYESVGKDDLRDLERCLRRLTAELDARDSAVEDGRLRLFGDQNPPRSGVQEALAVLGDGAAVTPGETPNAGEAGAATASQADETTKDRFD